MCVANPKASELNYRRLSFDSITFAQGFSPLSLCYVRPTLQGCGDSYKGNGHMGWGRKAPSLSPW